MGSGLGDLWDAKLNAWIFHWDYHQTFRDPLQLFHANIFHPARYALAFSENLWGAAIFGFPLYAAGASTLFVYNFLFLLGMFLSAMAAWALAREVTGNAAVSLLAGLVFAFVPWRLAQIPHVQFQWGAFLPLALLFVLRWLKGRRPPRPCPVRPLLRVERPHERSLRDLLRDTARGRARVGGADGRRP